MKALVTGASGLLGSNVVEMLDQFGIEAKVLLRKTSDTAALIGLNPEICYGDLNDMDSLISASRECKYIVHCAANTRQWNTSLQEHTAINTQGAINVYNAALVNNVQKIIFVSTANTLPLLHSMKLPVQTDYIKSKKAAEEAILGQKEIPAVVINPSFMIGARDAKPSSGQSILHYLNHKLVLCPAGGKSFIHVKDVAEAIVRATDENIESGRFLLANENMSYHDFFRLVRQVTGIENKIIPLPAPIADLVGTMGSILSGPLGIQVKATKENMALLNHEIFYDGSESYSTLKIKKRSVSSAIVDAVSWFSKHGYCKDTLSAID